MDDQLKRLMSTGLIGGLAWGTTWPVLAPYLRGLGYSGAQYGLVGSTAILSSALFTLVGGTLSDRYGARRVLTTGLMVQALALLLISSGETGMVAGGFFLNGVAGGLNGVAQQTLLSRAGREEELHYTFSYVSASNTFGGGVGSLLGWVPVTVSNAYGIPLLDAYRYTIMAAAILPVAAIPVVLTIEERRDGEPGGPTSFLNSVKRFNRRFYVLTTANVMIGFGAAMSIQNIDYYFAAKYNVNSASLGSVLGLQQLVMAGLMLQMPRLADRLGGGLRVYLIVSYTSIPLLVAMTLVDSFKTAAAIYLVRSVLMNVANPLFNAFIMMHIPLKLRGTASAFMSLAWNIPAGGGRAVGGWLLDVNLEYPLRATAVFYTLALTTEALVFRDELKNGEKKGLTRLVN